MADRGIQTRYQAPLNYSGEWTLVSQDMLTNTSTVRIQFRIYIDFPERYDGTKSGSIKINGVTYSSTQYINLNPDGFGAYSSIYLIDQNVTIPHDVDGRKTIDFAVTADGLLIANENYSLPTIQQSTTVNSFPNFTIGTDFTVTLDIQSGTFTNKLEFKVGNTVFKTINNATASNVVTLTTAEQDALYALVPNSTFCSVGLYCTTYNGGTQVGNITYKSAVATVPSSIIPTFTTITHSELNTGVSSIVGAYVKTLSNIRLTITGAVGAKSSTITNYKIVYNDVAYGTNTIDTGLIQWSGDNVITATVTDSRGRVATKTITINALDYVTPTVTAFSAIRCNSDGTANNLGTYVKITRNGTISSLNSKNQATVNVYTKLKASTDWGVAVNTSTGTLGQTSITGSPVVGTYVVTSSYDIKFTLADKFKTAEVTLTLSTGQVVMSLGETGVGIGKIWENGALDVQGNINVSGAINCALRWKHYGENHIIFDASNATSPTGTAVSNKDAQNAWTTTYPTLMGWNGGSTYGVRVDSARNADLVGSVSPDNLERYYNHGGTASDCNTVTDIGVHTNIGAGAPNSPEQTWGTIYVSFIAHGLWLQQLWLGQYGTMYLRNSSDSGNGTRTWTGWKDVFGRSGTTVPTTLAEGEVYYMY